MKKIAIMQPYFFPYIGYISLIKHTDQFIIFDTPQFIRHGWIERNRVLKQDEGWLYIKAPLVKAPQETAIKDMQIDNSQDWRQKILSQLQPYKKTAPYYAEVVKLVGDAITPEHSHITSLNHASLELICAYLGIKADIRVFSQMDLDIETVNAPDEWALNICKALDGISEYWNPPGGQEFFDRKKYENAGIKLVFQKVNLHEYDQKRSPFEPGLSIIDVMMFNSPEEINKMLDDYELL